MNALGNLIAGHQVWAVLAAGAVWNAFVGSLAAPTKDSKPFYVFLFKFANALAFNFQRARSTSIENSPNFQDAVAKYLASQADAAPAQPANLPGN